MRKDVKMNALKSEAKATSKDFQVLTDKALDQVFGGVCGSGGGSYYPSIPSTPSTPTTPTGVFTVPVKGEDTVHIDASIKDGNAEVKELTFTDLDKKKFSPSFAP